MENKEDKKNLAPKIRFPGFTDDWKQCKLGDVFDQTVNYVKPNEQKLDLWSLTVEDGLMPKTERYNREFLVKKDSNFKEVRPGDIVYNPMNMTLGAVGYNGTSKSVAVSGYYTTMVTKKGYDAYYINTWLKSPQAIQLYKKYATGSLIEKQRVQFPTLSIIPALFPNFDEQVKIGRYFKVFDEVITLNQQKLDDLKGLKKSLLQKMFPVEGKDIPEIRFPGFADSWKQRKLFEIVGTTYGGGTPATSNQEYWEGNIPWIQSSNLIEDQLFDIDVKKHISKNGLKHSAAQLVPENSVAVVTHVGVGKLVLMPYSYTTSQDFISLSDLKCNPKFLCYALYKRLQEDLHIVQGSAIKGITKNDLMCKQILLPEIEEQKKIGNSLQNLDTLITLHQQKLDDLKELKKGLLQQMFI